MVSMSVVKARDNLADALNRVAYGGERVILERHGKGVAAVVSMDDLALLEEIEDREDVLALREAREEMKRTGDKGVPLEAVAKRLGIKLTKQKQSKRA